MRSYPISIVGDPYRGTISSRVEKARKRNEIVRQIETYVNDKLKAAEDDTIINFSNYEIARALNLSIDEVAPLVFKIDCGSNGATICKGDPEKAFRRLHSVNAVNAKSPNPNFSVGEIVLHKHFGNGEIIDVDGDKLNINFAVFGEKRVLENFVEKIL